MEYIKSPPDNQHKGLLGAAGRPTGAAHVHQVTSARLRYPGAQRRHSEAASPVWNAGSNKTIFSSRLLPVDTV